MVTTASLTVVTDSVLFFLFSKDERSSLRVFDIRRRHRVFDVRRRHRVVPMDKPGGVRPQAGIVNGNPLLPDPCRRIGKQ